MDLDKAAQSMIDNLQKNTGLSLEEWIGIVKKENLAKHGEQLKFLKEKHGLTHGFANMIALKARGADAASAESEEDLIENQYKGKEHFKPLYAQLISTVQSFGSDVEIAPKKNYVSLRRKKQFALLQPATKTRYEVGIILKGQEGQGKLEAITATNAMCTHKINLTGLDDLDKEVISWLQAAYEQAE